MKRLSDLLDGFWFEKAPASRPALLRILIGVYTLYYVGSRYRLFLRIARSDPALFKPVGAVSYLEQPVSMPVFRGVLLATLASNVAFVLGIRHRETGPVFAGLLLWLMSYRNSWSMIYHSDNALVMHAAILGLTRSADDLSIDALVRSMVSGADGDPGDPAAPDPAGDWRYGWPVRLMNAATILVYFLSGVAKLKSPLGLRWAGGNALREQVAVDGLRKDLLGEGAAPLAAKLYRQVPLFTLLAVGTYFIELGAPAALLNKKLGRLWAAGTFSMHWGIYFVMKITFRYQLSGVLFAPFFDLDRVVEHLRRRLEDR